MPIRDVLVAVTVFALLPFCVVRPWVGALTWAWLSYMNPHKLAWGFASTMPFAAMVAVAMLVGLLLTTDKKPFLWTRETVLLVLLWGWFGVTTIFADYPDLAQDKLWQVSKILFMAFITVPLFQDRRRLTWLFLVIGGSIGYFGLKGGIGSLVYGGRATVFGPPGSFIASNNELGLALNMVLPILVFLARDEPRRWLRHGLRFTACSTVVAIAFTYSRGAVLCLALVLAALFLKGRQRILLLVVLMIGLLVFKSFVPERWVERMSTVSNYEADGSARARLAAWRVAYRIAAESPITGGGFRVFLDRNVYAHHGETAPRKGTDAHSVYFNFLGEHGWIGLGLFLALMGATFGTLRRVRKAAAGDPNRTWIANYAHMLQISFLAYLLAGAFVSAAYFDLMYQLVIIVAILSHLAAEPVAKTVEQTTTTAPVPVRPRFIWVPR